MAVFGIPVPRTDPAEVAQDARRAADCALAMAARLEDLNAEWRRRGMPEMTMRAGLDTGEVVGGTVGSASRLDYTVIGETANNAARLEGFDKDSAVAAVVVGGCRILTSGETAERLGDGYRIERVGAATLRGRTGQTVIHRIYPETGREDGSGAGAGADGTAGKEVVDATD
jgi:class 3 adenylate cyclase